jgi:multiple sugar transport system permease protein
MTEGTRTAAGRVAAGKVGGATTPPAAPPLPPPAGGTWRRAARAARAVRGRLTGRALPYVLLLPALCAELLVHLVPMVVGVGMSFFGLTQFYLRDWTQAPGPSTANYRVVLKLGGPVGRNLLHSFWVTLLVTILVVGLSWLVGTVAAILMQASFRGRAALRTMFLIPYALPVYTAAMTWNFMFQHDTGAVNSILYGQLHLLDHRSFWLIGNNAFYSLVAVELWRVWPFAFLTVTAGLQSVPRDLYEAASLDGAGVWGQIRSVTLPMLAPVNRVLVIVLFLWTFNDFTTPYTLFGRSAPHSADMISLHIYNASFVTWNFGLGSAMSVLMLLFLMLAVGAYLLMTRVAGRRRVA